ncbi:MAG: tyrosine-type recombinase/integrase [Bacteroidetes bacterium]|nr:tyrosine-type recombinase/integrase [Bacteroidota bacterium]
MFLTRDKKSPFYQIVYFVDGNRTKKSTKKKTKSEAGKVLKKFLFDFNGNEVKVKLKSVSLAQFRQEYITYCKSCRSHSYIERSIIPAFNKFTAFIGAANLNKISSRQVDKFITSINSYSTSSAGLYYRTLKAAFSKAVVWEYIQENPFKKIKAPKQVKSLPIFINKEDFQTILDHTKHQFLKDIFITGFYSGMRLGELVNMNWSWIDFNQNLITVKNSNGFTTKSKEERVIPIHQKVKEVLTNRYSTNGKSAFIFYRNSGTKLNEDFVSKQFKKAVRQAVLSDDIHFHTLRHSFASNLVQSGSSLYIVKELLGHQDFQTTQIYSHLQRDNLSQAVNLL